MTGLGSIERVTLRPELGSVKVCACAGSVARGLASSPACRRAATGRGAWRPRRWVSTGSGREESSGLPRPARGVSGSTKEGLRRPPARPSGAAVEDSPPRLRARGRALAVRPPQCTPPFPRAPSRVGLAAAGPRSCLPALPPAAGRRWAVSAVRLPERAFPAEEAVRSFGRAPGRKVPPGAHRERGGEGPGFACSPGEQRWDRGRAPAPSGSGIPGPLAPLNVRDGRGLVDPVRHPPLPLTTDRGNGRLESGKFSHTARQWLFCDTMLLRVVGNSVVQCFFWRCGGHCC